MRAGSVAMVATGIPLLATFVDRHPHGTAATVLVWALWCVVLVAALVPSPWSLTVLRVATTLYAALVGGAAIDGVPAVQLGLAAAGAVVAGGVAWSAATGAAFVQAEAYGDERRFPLRAPAAFLAPIVLTGASWLALAVTTVALVVHGLWVPGAVVGTVWLASTWFLLPRWHRFTRRWLVMVPAGVVLHDHLVLGETMLLPRRQIATLALAREGTGALDLSGPAAGHLVEITLSAMATLVIRPGFAIGSAPGSAGGSPGGAVHAGALLVAPSRPGTVLAALSDVC